MTTKNRTLPFRYTHVVHQIGKLRHPFSGFIQHVSVEESIHPFGFMCFNTGVLREFLLHV